MLTAEEFDNIESNDKSIEKSGKLSKIRKSSKSGKTKSQKLSISQNSAKLRKI